MAITNDYIADRLREIANEIDDGTITLITYKSGEGISNPEFSGHSLELSYRRMKEVPIPASIFSKGDYENN